MTNDPENSSVPDDKPVSIYSEDGVVLESVVETLDSAIDAG